MKTAASLNDCTLQRDIENNQVKCKLKQPSASARLAVFLFSTGLALLAVGFFSK
jgi:hypothetical protein